MMLVAYNNKTGLLAGTEMPPKILLHFVLGNKVNRGHHPQYLYEAIGITSYSINSLNSIRKSVQFWSISNFGTFIFYIT